MTSAFSRRAAFAAYSGGAVAIGYALRGADEEQKRRQLPMGWRACCESRALTPAQQALPDKLTAIVGALNVERGVEQRGSRMGRGEAFVVVKPGSLREALEALQACVDADACVIPQGANTGLTGGSVPREMGVDRPTVVINMLRLNHIMPIDDGKRMVCLAGAGIHSVLQKAATLGKESHSVLGSIFLNPTTAAGIAFGSGGTQLRKGPVYTERLLYARVNAHGKVELIDSLGIVSSDDDELFRKLESGELKQEDVDGRCGLAASQTTYGSSVCACHGKRGGEISRFNASTEGPDANRSEGKVLILASVHDTFDKPVNASTLWISVDDFATAQRLKRDVCLAGGAADLPVSCEVSHWWRSLPTFSYQLPPILPPVSTLVLRSIPPLSLVLSTPQQYMDRDSVTAVDEAGRVLCYLISQVGYLTFVFSSLFPATSDSSFFRPLFFRLPSPCDLLLLFAYISSPSAISSLPGWYWLHTQVDVGREAPLRGPPHPDGRHHRRQGALPPQLALPQRAAVAGACPDREARPPSPGDRRRVWWR